jgi:hypothetical protein
MMGAWPIVARVAGIRWLFLFIGFSGTESSTSYPTWPLKDRRMLSETDTSPRDSHVVVAIEGFNPSRKAERIECFFSPML